MIVFIIHLTLHGQVRFYFNNSYISCWIKYTVPPLFYAPLLFLSASVIVRVKFPVISFLHCCFVLSKRIKRQSFSFAVNLYLQHWLVLFVKVTVGQTVKIIAMVILVVTLLEYTVMMLVAFSCKFFHNVFCCNMY